MEYDNGLRPMVIPLPHDVNDPELDELAIALFVTFARFEYALKATGFHKGDGPAEPNWRAFAESVQGAFAQPSQKLAEALDYILAYPPKRQAIRSGLIEWESNLPSTNLKADLALILVRRVRNNLFHGGKFGSHWFAPERSRHLLEASISILEECLAASETVREAYAH